MNVSDRILEDILSAWLSQEIHGVDEIQSCALRRISSNHIQVALYLNLCALRKRCEALLNVAGEA